MRAIRAYGSLTALVRRFLRQTAGVSAVEFALILPVMLVLYAGCVEVTTVLSLDRKISRAASTITDLVAQNKTLTSAQVSNFFDATTAILEPYSASTAKILLVVVDVKSTGQTVAWSAVRRDTAPTTGTTSPLTVPTALATVGTQVVVGRVTYSYVSPFASFMSNITGHTSYNLDHVFYLKPRQGTSITYSG